MGLAATDLYALGELLAGEPIGVVELGRRLVLHATDAARTELLGRLTDLTHDTDRLAARFSEHELQAIERLLTAAAELYPRPATRGQVS